MAQLIWTEPALLDLDEIAEYIALDNFGAAQRLIEKVFKRDNWICQKCGQKGGKLHPHHIKHFADYPELRFEVDNGITLCRDCHKTKHNHNFGGI